MDQEEKSLDPWMLLGDLGNIMGELADYFLSLSLLQQARVYLVSESTLCTLIFPGTLYGTVKASVPDPDPLSFIRILSIIKQKW
jgi:hypothetical protein